MNMKNEKPRIVVSIADLGASVAGSAGEAEVSKASTRTQAPPARPGLKPPDLLPVLHCLEYSHPTFREPEKGELILGLYREDDGTAAPVLLWTDPKVDLFWDVNIRQHVKPPKWYLRLAAQPPIDPVTGYPVIQGAVCPF
jgi:hypothetical protein